MTTKQRIDTTPATRRTADTLRTAADEVAAWTAEHDTPVIADRAVERAADWSRGAARRIEDEPARAVVYETERVLRRRPWVVPLTMLAVTGVAFGIAAVLKSRRRRAERDRQIQAEETYAQR